MARREDRRGSELPSLERLVTLTTLLLGRLAVETSEMEESKEERNRGSGRDKVLHLCFSRKMPCVLSYTELWKKNIHFILGYQTF